MRQGTVRAVLVADLVVRSGVAQTSDVVEALRTFWADEVPDAGCLIEVLRRQARLSRESLAAAEADRLMADAEGDAPRTVPPPPAESAAGGPALRPMPGGWYVDFVPVGEGGMGIVYLAFDTELHWLVALEIVRPDAGGGAPCPPPPTPFGAARPQAGTPAARAFDALAARFLQDAWVTGGLEHPGVVPVHALGRTASGIPYYTMRFVPGQRTLRDALDDLASGDGAAGSSPTHPARPPQAARCCRVVLGNGEVDRTRIPV